MKLEKRRFLLLVVSVFTVSMLILSGCSVKTPTAKVTDAEIYDLTTKKVKLKFAIRIDNPNPLAITVNKIAYDFKAFDKQVVSETMDKAIRIPENGKAEFKLPVNVSYSKLLSAGLTTIAKGKLEYTITIKITIDTPVGDITLPISKSGTLKNKDLGKFFGSLDGDDNVIDLGAVTQEIKLDIIDVEFSHKFSRI